jgi:hypothetical protein
VDGSDAYDLSLASCTDGRYLQFCSAWGLPISVRTSRGFRFVCAECKRPFASPQIIGRTTLSPEILILIEFEAALRDALQNERNLRFPGAWIGPKVFLQMVEDLSWLLTRRTEGNGRLFVQRILSLSGNGASCAIPKHEVRLFKGGGRG